VPWRKRSKAELRSAILGLLAGLEKNFPDWSLCGEERSLALEELPLLRLANKSRVEDGCNPREEEASEGDAPARMTLLVKSRSLSRPGDSGLPGDRLPLWNL